ncbi:MAG TPA: PDZ domain-containing protein [Thermoanaerobaculia bacterium]|nr:PDZ domain-containing protein [Thermoanaerobaculia bacterium]
MPDYLLSWGAPAARLFDITIRFIAPADTPRLLLPAWRPGRYLIQNYAANVREWGAGERRMWKDGKTSWRVEARAGEAVTVSYRYYAGVLDAGSSFLDDDEAYVNGTNLFMLVEGLRNEEHRLTVAAPAEWRIETQLPREEGVILSREDGEGSSTELRGKILRSAQDDTTTFVARDYDHLVDSPIIAAATMTRHSFVEGGARFHLVFRGDEGVDTEQFVEPVRVIARTQAELFGGLPFREYRFLIHLRDKWHGVEHEDSCSIIARGAALLGARPGDDGYDHLLSICSHELFHAWNVKRIVPERFRPYDYWQETPTRLLWAMEGLTSYYGDLTLVRGGIWSVERYLEHLRKEIETLESQPARLHLPLSQASLDGWLSDPAQMHDYGNAWYSFYTKGELVAAMLDLTVRRATEGAKSLDDVVRLLWEEYGTTGRGLEEDGIERAVARVADVGDFFARYVDGIEALPYAELFGAAGVAFASLPREGASLAVKLSDAFVVHAIRGGAGMDAGLLPGDELLSLGDTRVTNETTLAAVLRGLPLGETVELLVARAGVLKRLTVEGRRDPRPRITLKAAEKSAMRESWLRRNE